MSSTTQPTPTTVSESELDELERLYASPPPPSCPVCGGEMQIGACGGGEVRWLCIAASKADWMGSVRTPEWEHMRDSSVTQRTGDSRVISLIATARAYHALREAADTLALEAHEVTESWAEGHITGMVELSLAVRAYYAATDGDKP